MDYNLVKLTQDMEVSSHWPLLFNCRSDVMITSANVTGSKSVRLETMDLNWHVSLSLSFSLSLFNSTYSIVICETRSKLVKSALVKLSLYWPILIASSQSSTVLKLEKSGMLRSSKGKCTLRKTNPDHPHTLFVIIFMLQFVSFSVLSKYYLEKGVK